MSTAEQQHAPRSNLDRAAEIDPILKARNEAVEAPMREFGRSLLLLSDGYLRSHASDLTLAAALDGR